MCITSIGYSAGEVAFFDVTGEKYPNPGPSAALHGSLLGLPEDLQPTLLEVSQTRLRPPPEARSL